MSLMKNTYMLGKLAGAVERLVVGEGDARSRLLWAYDYLVMVHRDMLPPHLVNQWDIICNDLQKYPAQYGRTAAEMTMKRIRNSTASKIAMRVLSLYIDLQTFCDTKD